MLVATYRRIEIRFWADPWVEALEPEERYMFLYLITNSATTPSGIYVVTPKRISNETGIPENTVKTMLSRHSVGTVSAQSNHGDGKILWDPSTSTVFVLNFLRIQGDNPSFAASAINDLKGKPKVLVDAFCEHYRIKPESIPGTVLDGNQKLTPCRHGVGTVGTLNTQSSTEQYRGSTAHDSAAVLPEQKQRQNQTPAGAGTDADPAGRPGVPPAALGPPEADADPPPRGWANITPMARAIAQSITVRLHEDREMSQEEIQALADQYAAEAAGEGVSDGESAAAE